MANRLLDYCLRKPYFRNSFTPADVYTAVKKTAVSFFMETLCDINEIMNPELLREVTDNIIAIKGHKVGTWSLD